MQIEALHNYFKQSTGICTDTRSIRKGCLFFALKGEKFDGNKFVQEALDKGAFKVVIDSVKYHKETGETLLCKNTLIALQELACFHRKYLNIPIIAITGSNGKTTTKELIHSVLSQKFNTVATKGNLNNHIGVPLTLLSMASTTELGIVEMGANHLQEIQDLCSIATPDFGYITNFGKAHLEGFGSLEGVIKGKTELYKYLKEHQKIAFVNGSDTIQLECSSSLERIIFGGNQTDYEVTLKDATGKIVVSFDGLTIHSNLLGEYNYSNIAAAIAIGAYFEVTPEQIKRAIESYIPSNNRSQLLDQGTNSIILDAYNANPTSMIAALRNFNQATGKEKILFLGDMFELGNEAEKEHQNIVDFLEENSIGEVFLIGSNFLNTQVKSTLISKFKDFDALKSELTKKQLSNKFILIKASRGMALERILDFI